MKKNKGFTIVELLAVIVIIGILAGIAIPVYYNVTKSVKEHEYNVKKKYIEEVAVRYAEENSVLIDDNEELTTIFTSVRLITSGYLSAEKYISHDGVDIPFIQNPNNPNDNLVCHVINLKLEDYTYYAEVSDTDINCNLSSKEVGETTLGIKAYEIKDDNTLGYEMSPSINNYFKWVKNDVALVINPSISFDVITYDFGGKKYTVDKSNMFTGNAYGINQSIIRTYSNVIVIKGISGAEVTPEYKFMVRSGDNIYYSTVHLRIDKRAPRIDNYQSTLWSNNKKETVVYINDGSGSGPKGICYSTINNRNSATCVDVEDISSYYKSKTVKISALDNGSIYIWPIDMVGNEPSAPSTIIIKNVDSTSPSLVGINWVIDSDISCDNGIQCTNPLDTTCTCRKEIDGEMVPDDLTYDRARNIKISYSDTQSGVRLVKYCITQNDTCEANIEANKIFNNGNLEAEIKWDNNDNAQRVCYFAMDNVGNTTDTNCTEKFFVDEIRGQLNNE